MIVESIPLLLRHQEQLLQFCQDLAIVINWKKSDLEQSSRAQDLGMPIDTIQERVFLVDYWTVSFQDLANSFLLPLPTRKNVVAVVGSLGVFRAVCSQGSHTDALSLVAA